MTEEHGQESGRPPAPRWWISVDGGTDGPYSHAFVVASLKSSRFNRETLACPEGSQQWKPLDDWPQFASEMPVEPKWWINANGETDGPFGQVEITQQIGVGRVNGSTLACRDGSTEWKSISEIAEFASELPSPTQPQSPPPSTSPGTIAGTNRQGTTSPYSQPFNVGIRNQPMPAMAEAIGIYCLVIRPIIGLLFFCLSCVSASEYAEGTPHFVVETLLNLISIPIDIFAMVLLIIGGLKLRQRYISAVTFIRFGLGASLGFGLLFFVAQFVVGFNAGLTESPAEVSQQTPVSDAEVLLGLLLLAVALACLVFEIVALIWLSNNARRLPLTRGR